MENNDNQMINLNFITRLFMISCFAFKILFLTAQPGNEWSLLRVSLQSRLPMEEIKGSFRSEERRVG